LEDTFQGLIDHVLDSGPKLIVIGEVQVRPRLARQLTRRSPQGINPNILILDVTSERPHGKAARWHDESP